MTDEQRERYNAYHRKYYREHKERIREINAAWIARNYETYKARKNEYDREYRRRRRMNEGTELHGSPCTENKKEFDAGDSGAR